MALSKNADKKIKALVKKRGIDCSDCRIFASGDLDTDCNFRESWFFVFAKELVVVNLPRFTGIKTFSGYPHKENYAPPSADELEIERIPIESIKKLFAVDLAAGVLLCGEIDGGTRRLAVFSAGKGADARKLCEGFEIIKKEQPLSDEFFKVRENPEFCEKCGTPYTDRERRICPKCTDTRSLFMRTMSYFEPYKIAVAVLVITFLASAAANSLLPYLSGTVYFDDVLGKKSDFSGFWSLAAGDFFKLLVLMCLAFAAVRIFNLFLTIVQNIIVAKIVPRVVRHIKSDIFASLKNLSMRFFTNRTTGSLMTRVMSDANEVTGLFLDILPALVGNLANVALTIAFMVALNWQMTVMTLVLTPLLVIISVKLHPRLWHFYGKRHRAERSMNSTLNDSLTGVRVIKAFGKEDEAVKNFEGKNAFAGRTEVDIVKYENRYNAVYTSVQSIMQLGVWGIGAYLILTKTNTAMSYGVLATFIAYVTNLAGPLDFMSNVFRMVASSMNASQRIFEIIDAKPDVVEKKNAFSLENPKGTVEFDNVTFSYEKGHPVLHNISLKVEAGEMLGIVGRSGMGKSTLVSLISRLYDPDSGQVLIDGHDLKDLTFESLKGTVAMVSQESYIFMGTVAENIAYAKPDATREEILAAAAAAGAHNFICKFPDGYDSLIGSGGRQLSGGERQRLSLARAILADPKILILDEATAAVDTATERNIQLALDRLSENRTTISIAHRLSTLKNADKLVVLDEGKAVEQGTHEQLMELKGIYYKLQQLQSRALSLNAQERTM